MFSRDVQKKYKLNKSQVDNIIRRYKLVWGLVKNHKGRITWNNYAITQLEEYLALEKAESVGNAPSRAVATDVFDAEFTQAGQTTPNELVLNKKNEKMALIFAQAISEKLDIFKNEIKEGYVKEIYSLKEQNKLETELLQNNIENLKNSHKVEITELTNQFKSLKSRLGHTQAQFEKRNEIFEDRLERRTQPTTFFGQIYKFLVQTPILVVERRKKSVNGCSVVRLSKILALSQIQSEIE